MLSTIIFDLDGTLADTGPDLLNALNHSIKPFNLEPLERQQLGHLVGHGSIAMIDRAFSIRNVAIDEQMRSECQNRFLEFYKNNIANETVLFDGVEKLLDELKEAGFCLAVCTNKQEHFAHQLIGELRISNYFSAVTGGDSFDFKKPDPRHLTRTAELANGNAKSTLMLGDTITDIDAAKQANIPVIAVDFGYSDVPIETLAPDFIISHFDDALPIIKAQAAKTK